MKVAIESLSDITTLGAHRSRGFALVFVLWGLALISVLFLSYIAPARYRLQVSANLAGAAQAEILAEAAINIGIVEAAKASLPSSSGQSRLSLDGRPLFCMLPQKGVAAILLEDEGGKIDLNGASPELLGALLRGFGVEFNRVDDIIDSIVSFRSATTNNFSADESAYRAAGRDYGPKRALFQTTLELGQVLGIDEGLFKRLLPFVTVYSSRSGIDPKVAPPALLAALATDAKSAEVEALIAHPYPNSIDRTNLRLPPGVVAAASSVGAFLLHAEVIMPSGAFAVREAIFVFQPGTAFRIPIIKEWRGGATRYPDILRLAHTGGQTGPNC